ncbi:lipid IV(A) 3-deoxy-D-manno-octulosonic acid transferase [Luteimonas terricola]|uniref:3-deoxy-D-manno-octulosonic acid transferase n=1 Tax=Luteimonas terricola TaxID=645597 RepID=A0ABQ2E6L5_9GAMM|nr:lipid IV(A) 3-deoxy-D-manno-octulosonic acid transferase [Luteimonas terricola]GGJ98474.1 3-deoxy-D-manno-octulosonic acid transferase [Luteimonas terricola]
MEAAPRDRAVERLLRGLYSAALYLLLPVTVYHLVWRGFRQAEYLERWGERYAAYRTPPLDDGCVWVHAVSVGEVNAAAPLVNALLEQRPDLRLLVTTITPTGSARVRALWGERVDHVYLPYDLSGAVRRFLGHFRPRLALVLETELWPNLLFCSRDHGIPAYLVNARLSERSLRGYRVLRPLIARALRTLARVAAQSEADGARFVRLGAKPEAVSVLGNLKFDITVDDAARRISAAFTEHSGGRLAWIAASTHPEEEAAVIAIHRRLRARWPDLVLLWAPRHPERFRPVAQACVEAGWRVATRKLTRWPDGGDDVFVIDTLGELVHFYPCARVAFVGGSLQAVGGHNLLEPAALGVAVVTGPHLHNFVDIARRMDEAGALRIGADTDAVGDAVGELLADDAARAAMVAEGLRLVQEGRGALARTLAMITPELPPA